MQSNSDDITRLSEQSRFDDETIGALKELGTILLAIRSRIASEGAIIAQPTYDQSKK
jgi:hypothetical protein